jgi:hypothetical protein
MPAKDATFPILILTAVRHFPFDLLTINKKVNLLVIPPILLDGVDVAWVNTDTIW